MKITTTLNELAEKYIIQIEESIKLSIQPKPKWLPNFIWIKILHRLLILSILEEQ